jgi:putative DNA primase/helicase
MTDLFDRAKTVGLSHVKSWLPNGKQEGPEWVALNPTRIDNKEGSFKINTSSGKWKDFASDEGGNDTVSLFAYLNRSEMESRAGKYKNFEGGVQAEAAKEILTRHDPSYFPDSNDDFTPKKSGDFWEGYRCLTRGLKDSPDPYQSIKYLSKHFGDFKQQWTFTDKKGLPLLIIARYYKDGKKNDRPFTLWQNGSETKWRSKNLSGCKNPLYNLPAFDENPNLAILMVEGQKNAEDSRELLSNDFVSTSLYGGVKNSDLEPLRGRTLYYWFDPDAAGRKKLKQLKDAVAELDCIFHAVHSPTGKPPGWDISDAIKEGWNQKQLIDHVMGDSDEKEEEYFLDDDALPFRIIGQTSSEIFFFPKETKLIMRFKRSGLGKANLMNLMSVQDWAAYYAKPDGGIAWDSAANYLIRRASQTEIFTSSIVRGSGAWMENGELILNTGRNLIIRGKEHDLFQMKTKYVYEKKHLVPFKTSGGMSTAEASKLLSITKRLDFEFTEFSYLLAGWMMLAPFGGALEWRPHVWLTGSKGSGKSWVLENVVFPMVGAFGIKALGTSTTAGIRQKLGNCSKPVMIDEAESDNLKQKDRIEEMLSMARQASSGAENSAAILHGTQDGEGLDWIVKSMFMFASIGPALVHTADKSRVSLLTLKTPRRAQAKEREIKFNELRKWVALLTEAWAVSFHARTMSIFPEVLKAINIFCEQATELLGTRREGDQIGTMIAGAYMIEHEESPSAAEARSFLEGFDFIKSGDENAVDKEDEELCLDQILSYKIQVHEKRYTIGTWLKYYFFKSGSMYNLSEEFDDINDTSAAAVKRELEEYGIKPIKEQIYIAVGHPAIRTMLRETPWQNTYHNILGRLEFCSGTSGPTMFAGIQKRYKKFNAELILYDEIPF